jgi:hypothetical protein
VDGGGQPTVRSGNPKVAAAARAKQAERDSPPEAHLHADDDDHPFGSRRYTPPTSAAIHQPSPMWVPVLMFTFFAVGLLAIVLSYAGVLPGSQPGGSAGSYYLVGGLLSILGGIITATQYR